MCIYFVREYRGFVKLEYLFGELQKKVLWMCQLGVDITHYWQLLDEFQLIPVVR